jgi:hypothetical protein
MRFLFDGAKGVVDLAEVDLIERNAVQRLPAHHEHASFGFATEVEVRSAQICAGEFPFTTIARFA